MRIIILICCLWAIGVSNEFNVGETRLGVEKTVSDNYDGDLPLTFKFKQKLSYGDLKLTTKVYDRTYNDYKKLQVWNILKYNFIRFEDIREYKHSGKDDKSRLNLYMLYFKPYEILNISFGIGNNLKHEDYGYLVLEGKIFKTGKHKLGYESYNRINLDTKDKKYGLELQYKYRVKDNIDLYTYNVSTYDVTKNKLKARLDIGVYFYF